VCNIYTVSIIFKKFLQTQVVLVWFAERMNIVRAKMVRQNVWESLQG